ncbi:hypothetical protein SAMN04487996_10365 [Dyadobacter soli]|uniref:Lipocalin-like domain-containing protein n=1 Tax=Dyadobacter soli TaxID=659014 RepID=A0A1G6ZBT0_9BACT|nr:hypothetical protein [Dyadobacter soli]SDD99537.1 hypothetical protein SAMN04487996_10365 [Dyadobacter soli]
MKNVILILAVLFFTGCAQRDPVRGDATANFTGTFKYAIASPTGFVSKYTWVVTRHAPNVLDFDMTKVIVRADGSEIVSRDKATEVEITDEKRLQFSYNTTSGRLIMVTALAAPKKLHVNGAALQGEDFTNVPWYGFEKQ